MGDRPFKDVADFIAQAAERAKAKLAPAVDNPVVESDQDPDRLEQAAPSTDGPLEDLTDDSEDIPPMFEGAALQPAYRTEADVSPAASEPVGKSVDWRGPLKAPGPLQRRHDAMVEARELITQMVTLETTRGEHGPEHDQEHTRGSWVTRALAWLELAATK